MAVATVLTVYGIETLDELDGINGSSVATVLTVYGIETGWTDERLLDFPSVLQQYLPFTVLKQLIFDVFGFRFFVATVLTVYGIETTKYLGLILGMERCNSTYRLRY